MDQNNRREELSLALLDEYRNTAVDDLYAGIKKTISRRRKFRALGRVAAVLLPVFIAAGTWYWFAGGEDTAVSGERFHGNAVLTTGSGEQIVLERTAERKLLAESDGVVILNGDDGLSYERTGVNVESELYSTLSVPKGMTYALTLEDGSHVWLNADSRLRFPSAFGRKERRVHLEGEACFDVVPDSGRPFMVESAEQTVTVTGTVFNIYAYPGEPGTYTTLISGGVELNFGNENVSLRPGQQARLTGSGFSIVGADTDHVTLWKDGIFSFNDNTLENIFSRLARWYDIKYVFDDPEAAGQVLMGNLPVYDEIDPVLNIINMAGKVSVERAGRVVRIGMKK